MADVEWSDTDVDFVARSILECGRNIVPGDGNIYFGVANSAMNANIGFKMTRNGKVVAVSIINANAVTRIVDVRVNNSVVNRVHVSLVNQASKVESNLNLSFVQGDYLTAGALIAVGEDMTNVIVLIEVEWGVT